MDVVELRLDDDSVLLVEARPADTRVDGVPIDRVARPQELAHRASESLQATLQKVRPALQAIVDQLGGLADFPDRITVQFGITVTAAAGVVVASGTTAANFTVTAEWRRPSPRVG